MNAHLAPALQSPEVPLGLVDTWSALHPACTGSNPAVRTKLPLCHRPMGGRGATSAAAAAAARSVAVRWRFGGSVGPILPPSPPGFFPRLHQAAARHCTPWCRYQPQIGIANAISSKAHTYRCAGTCNDCLSESFLMMRHTRPTQVFTYLHTHASTWSSSRHRSCSALRNRAMAHAVMHTATHVIVR